MTLVPNALLAARRARGGLRRPRRFRASRSRIVVLASVAGVFVQLAGFPVAPAEAATAAVTYTYDASGRLATVTTAAGTATYHYDAEGNLLSVSSPVAGPAHAAAAARRAAAAAPVITSAGPSVVSGPGQTITIGGRGFSPAAVTDIVRVGPLMAHVTTASATRLQVAAPPGTGGVVTVTTPGGTARGPSVKIKEPRTPILPVPGRDAHPLRAPAGVTALSGLVQDNHGQPLPGVTISVASVAGRPQATTATNATGHFLLARLGAGLHQLIISADHVGGRQYGTYAEPVELPRRAGPLCCPGSPT